MTPQDVLVRLDCIADRINAPADFEIDPEDDAAILVEVAHELDALLLDVRSA